ncbi:MAG: alanine--tRNA ligase [Candidatus Omnitrophica bacterium]|nr:alanine--tRNA ligase [Candidatus Omnitrophota bacterium]
MKSAELRKRFLDFFKARGHAVIKSDSLIPRNDPTLLFTGAGMNQFKDYFLGLRTDLKRAASVQKCLRTGDLDQVGKTPYHHSFFEMLGNFSFGDYFKEEAIAWAWEFFTKELGIPRERLFVSVHEKDHEALAIWVKKIGVPEKLIAHLDDKSNFWPSNAPKLGPDGPCGPCSEIYFDQGEHYPGATKKFWADDDSGRYAEVWNLVFTQFEREKGGKLVPLKSKNIDTGMGLERLACLMQGKQNNFETDIFELIHRDLRLALGFSEKAIIPSMNSLYAMSDHVRAIVFAVTDGAIPANEGRGYVIRKLIRRALWHAHELLNVSNNASDKRIENPFLYQVVPTVVKTMRDAYPELAEAQNSVQRTLEAEEERFLNTLETGLRIIEDRLRHLKGKKEVPAEIVFELYDTYGFPDELTRIIAKKSGFTLDEKGFQKLFEEQRKRAKASSKLADTIFAVSDINQDLAKLSETRFLGYQTMEAEGKVIWTNFSGEKGAIVLQETPFYPEGGGQVGDIGMLKGNAFEFLVQDTQKKERVTIHYGKLLKGKVNVGDSCRAIVSKDHREATKRNHTATHLLQAALRAVIGTHIRQVGSLVNAEKLRFDFTHGEALTREEIKRVEDWVNQAVLEAAPVEVKRQSYDTAMRGGVLAFFGDKYGNEVRVIEVPGRSKELCGGTHCHQTGEIGAFVITSETSIGSGTRRIEALTGMNIIQYLRRLQETMDQLSLTLKVSSDQVVDRVEKLQKKMRELERSNSNLTKTTIDSDELIRSAQTIGDIHLIAQNIPGEGIEFLRHFVDQVRNKMKQSVIALFSSKDAKISMIVALSKDLATSKLDAKEMAQKAAECLEGSAGGRKDLAQGGGRNEQGIEKAIESIAKLIRKTVGI